MTAASPTTGLRRPRPGAGLGAAVVVGASALVLWLVSGVALADAALYAGYELAFVIAPGLLVLRLVCPGVRSLGWQLALGWPLGLVMELLAFVATAALDVRDLYTAYPLLVCAPAAALIARRHLRARLGAPAGAERPGQASASILPRAEVWSLAAICLVTFGFVALMSIIKAPLPGTVDNVFYNPDTMFHIGVAAEATHHWPPAMPQVEGVGLHYHYLAHLHVAAIGQATGIDLTVVFMRLYLFPLIAVIVLQAAMAGRAITGLAWAAPVTAALVLLVRALELTIPDLAPFLDGNSFWLWNSASYTFGLVFFIPLVVLLAALLEPAVLQRIGLSKRAAWPLALVLLVGAGGSKVVSIPVILGGLLLYLAWTWIRRRRLDRTAVAALFAGAAVFLVYLAALYRGGEGGLGLGVGASYELMPALRSLETLVPDSAILEIAFWGTGAVIGTALLFGPVLLGLFWVLGKGRPPLRNGQALLLFIFAAGLLAFLFIHDDRGNENYFVGYGLVAALPVAAEGLHRGLGAWIRSGRDVRRVVLVAGAWLGLCLGLAYVGWELNEEGHPARSYALVYLGFAAGFVGLFLWARAALPRPARAALLSLAILVPASADMVLDSVPATVRDVREGTPLYAQLGVGVTPDSYEAARWMEENLPEDVVLAASFSRTPDAAAVAPVRFELPALAERRTFYEGWAYTPRAMTAGSAQVFAGTKHPYRQRHELARRLFVEGDPAALRTMAAKFGVTHLVVDKERGAVDGAVYRMGPVVFSNPRVDVIEIGDLSAAPERP